MTNRTLILIAALCFALSSHVFGVVYIPDQQAFDETARPWQAENNPYILGINQDLQPVDTEFLLDLGQNLQINEGVQVQMAANVNLIGDGNITVGDDEAAHVETLFEPYEGQRWGSIVLRGNGQGNNGHGTFYNTTIRGGGDAAAGYGGLIVLTNREPDVEGTTMPVLTLWAATGLDCALLDSETDGIYVFDPQNQPDVADNSRVSSTINATNMRIGDAALFIQHSGIHFADWVDEGVSSVVNIDHTIIEHCKEYGIWHEWCRTNGWDENDGFILNVNNESLVRFNNLDGVRLVCPDNIEGEGNGSTEMQVNLENSSFINNGTGEAGWGFIIRELPSSWTIGMRSHLQINACVFNDNQEGGLCLWKTGFDGVVTIENSTFNGNGNGVNEDNQNPDNLEHGHGALIYMRSISCDDNFIVHFKNNQIHQNGLTGLQLRLDILQGEGDPLPGIPRGTWFVKGNNFYRNGQQVVWQAEDPNDAREGADILVRHDVITLEMSNNRLAESICGIYVDSHFQEEFNRRHSPFFLGIYDNIQYGELTTLGRSKYGLVIEPLRERFFDRDQWWGDDAVYNNVFWDNTISGALIQTENLTDLEFCNNILGSTNGNPGLIGIEYTGDFDARPTYHNNGFFGNNDDYFCDGDADWAGVDDVQENPQFESAVNREFHLRWNSPMIDMGIENEDPIGNLTTDPVMRVDDFNGLPGYQLDRDGTRNDIGAYGGFRAHGDALWVEAEDDYGWDPYCVINADCDQLSGNLRDEYYRAYSDYEVPAGQTLTIEPGAFIEHNVDLDPNLYFTVWGRINVNGNVNDPVYFTGQDQARWGGIRVESTASWESRFEFTHVSCATCGLYFSAVPDGPEPENYLNVRNCTMMNILRDGIRIYDTRVLIDGDPFAPSREIEEYGLNDLEHWYGQWDNTEHQWNSIRQVRGQDPGASIGLNVSTVLDNDVQVLGTKIFLCGNENQVDELTETGTMLYDADVHFTDASVFRNGNTGFAIMNYSMPVINLFQYPPEWQPSEDACDVFENGLTVNSHEDANGAEIYLIFHSLVNANGNDIVDLDGNGNPRGFCVFNAGYVSMIRVGECWWGVHPINNPALFFNIPDDEILIDWDDPHGPIDVENDNDWTANLTPMQEAYQLKQAGRYREAVAAFMRIIRLSPRDPDAMHAAKLILGCYDLAGWDMQELRSHYVDMAHDYDGSDLGRLANSLVPRTLIEERRFEDAANEYAALAENGRDEMERGMAQIRLLELQRIIDPDGIDAVADEKTRNEIMAILNRLLNRKQDSQPEVPGEFTISNVYPNPFNASVQIAYSLDEAAATRIIVYDLNGAEIARLDMGRQQQGTHKVVWQAEDAPSGVYFCRLQAGAKTKTVKLTLMR